MFTRTEVYSRYEILLENYCKVINIEALTMLDMVKKDILPAVIAYSRELSDTILSKKQIALDLPADAEEILLRKISGLTASLYRKVEELDAALLGVGEHPDRADCAKYYSTSVLYAMAGLREVAAAIRDTVLPKMSELRLACDEAETLTAKKYWPFPSYGEMLFSIQ